MNKDHLAGGAAEARHARFGRLPERISFADMIETKTVPVNDPARNMYNPEAAWTFMSCLAVDLGL